MLGAIAGDIVGSIYENFRTKRKDFKLFTPFSFYTDDTVLTVAVADAILNPKNYGQTIRAYARRYPFRGYGPKFMLWMISPFPKPYNSFGNGAAMRVSPIAYAFENEEDVLEQAQKSAVCTHNHPEGIKGAQAVAHAIFLARKKSSKDEIRKTIQQRYGYDLDRTVDEIRPSYRLNLTCQGSVPEAIVAFLDSNNFEDAIRNAVSLGGDADTQACIAGAIAEAFYGGIPNGVRIQTMKKLNKKFTCTIQNFYNQFFPNSL